MLLIKLLRLLKNTKNTKIVFYLKEPEVGKRMRLLPMRAACYILTYEEDSGDITPCVLMIATLASGKHYL